MDKMDSEVLYSKKSWLLENDPMTRANVTSGVFRNKDSAGGYITSELHISDCLRTVLIHGHFDTENGRQREVRKLRDLAKHVTEHADYIESLVFVPDTKDRRDGDAC